MRHAVLLAAVAATLCAVLCAAAPAALAQNNRTFVSGKGMDTNPCSATAPCRGFAQALSVTNAGGEITVLDSAGYGPVTITKAVTITAIGVEAAITATTTDGIDINAGASDVVTLRGLTLTQTGNTGANRNGIAFSSGGTLNIQNCVVRGFSNDGIHLAPTNAATVNVSDTIVSTSGSGGFTVVFPTGAVTAFFERVQALGNLNGFFFASNGPAITATVANSAASGNIGGLFVSGSGISTAMVVNSQIYENSAGLEAGGNGTLIIANSKINGNGSEGFKDFSTIKTFGNNYFANNGSNNGSLTPIAQQ